MMGMARRAFKGVMWCLAVLVSIPLVLLLIQLIGLSVAASDRTALERTDLVVVFSGASERERAGIQIANETKPEYFTIAGCPYDRFQAVTDKHLQPSITPIFIRQSTSTFEDAVITRDLSKQHGIQSVTLVTSSYHMLRARFALRLLLIGQRVHVQAYNVPYNNRKGLGMLRLRDGRRHFMWEVVKLAGTMAEMGLYAAGKVGAP